MSSSPEGSKVAAASGLKKDGKAFGKSCMGEKKRFYFGDWAGEWWGISKYFNKDVLI